MENKILRGLKDVIPKRMKNMHYAFIRKRNQRQMGSLNSIQRTITSLQTVPLRKYMENNLTSSNEIAHVPEQVSEIEINDSCNIDCVMCKTSLSTRKKGLMKLDLFEETIEKLAKRGMRTTVLHTIGDPLANRNLHKYLKILRDYKFTISNLSSNCLLLDRHLDTLFEYRDVIYNFRPSIDAASKEIYERIRFGGKWETLHDNLQKFAERNATASIPFPIVVNNIVGKENFHEIALIPNVFSYLAPPTDFRYAFLNSLSPQNDYFLTQNYFGNDFSQNAPCSTIWNSIYVLKDGSLTTCCRDYNGELVFGNIKAEDIGSSYNSEKLKSIRKAHLDRNIDSMPNLCQSCYIVDPRLSDLLNQICQFFYLKIKGHPSDLQHLLNQIGPKLRLSQFDEIFEIISDGKKYD